MVILSSTAIKPYKIVTSLENEIYISSIHNTNTTKQTKEKYLYLIVEDDWFDTLKITVENDLETGIAMKLSFTDAIGKPLGWKSTLEIDKVYANHTTLVYPFVYAWFVTDDIFLVKDQQGHADLNVYGIKIVTT